MHPKLTSQRRCPAQGERAGKGHPGFGQVPAPMDRDDGCGCVFPLMGSVGLLFQSPGLLIGLQGGWWLVLWGRESSAGPDSG